MTTTNTGGARHNAPADNERLDTSADARRTDRGHRPMRSRRLAIGPICVIAVGLLQACAAPNAADSTEPAAGTAAGPAASQPVASAPNRTGDRGRPAPVVEGSTPLAYVEAPTARPPSEPATAWAPDWFREGLSKPNGTLMACASAASMDLLDARRQAIDSATAIFREHDERAAAVERTVTRQLDDGRFHVWVRVAPEGG